MKNAAGDNDRDIELVRFFEETCAVLTPIIELDSESGFEQLHEACKTIKSQVGKNFKKVLEKIVSNNIHLNTSFMAVSGL